MPRRVNSLGRKHNTPDELQKHVLATYFTLRVGIVATAMVFPFVLWTLGALQYGLPRQGSMSAYYHATTAPAYGVCDQACPEAGRGEKEWACTPREYAGLCAAVMTGAGQMRNWFVGLLFGVGVFLYLYKGFSTTENVALNVAGALCVAIALYPMRWPPGTKMFTPHGFFAVAFFLVIAFVAIFCARDTLPLIRDEKKRQRYRAAYHLLGLAMAAFPIGAWVLTSWIGRPDVFWVEVAGIWTFGAYWMVKTLEIRRTEAERKALRRELKVEDGYVKPA